MLRALRWSAADLDLACAALGITELSPSALDDLAQLVELQARLELDLAATCTICGTDGGVDGGFGAMTKVEGIANLDAGLALVATYRLVGDVALAESARESLVRARDSLR